MNHGYEQANMMHGSRPRMHSVALVGMDGSGKSTQAELLRRTLTREGKRALVIHPFGRKLLAFLPRYRDTGTPHAGAITGAAAEHERHTRGLYAVAELLDIGAYAWVAYIRSSLLAHLGTREVWLVSDRSFDDLLIKHLRRGSLSARGLALARRLAPHAEKTVWLCTLPEVAMARDREFAPSYYEELYTAYASTAQTYGWDIVSTADRSPAEVLAEVERVLGLPSELTERQSPTTESGRS